MTEQETPQLDYSLYSAVRPEYQEWLLPSGVVSSDHDRKDITRGPISLDKLIAWEPTPFQQNLYTIAPDFSINPTYHAVSQSGSVQERGNIEQGLTAFLADPDTQDYITETFAVSAKKFKDRPPLKIVADGQLSLLSPGDKYSDYILKLHSSSLYFILGNEHHALASIGFNQFADGVEIQYIQGINAGKIGDSAKDFNRLGNGLEKLTDLTERYARYKKLKYSMILPASENIWVNETIFPMARAKKIYDDMAENRGYNYNDRLKRYIKTITA